MVDLAHDGSLTPGVVRIIARIGSSLQKMRDDGWRIEEVIPVAEASRSESRRSGRGGRHVIEFPCCASEIVTLDPLVAAPIRDVNDIAVMQTAIIGEADVLCTKDEDFFEQPAGEYLRNMGISVVDDISLMHRLRF
jgi:hypothetical protein